MKTIAFDRSNRGLNWTALGLIAGLVGLYFYRRQGGTMNDLWQRGSQRVNTARDYLNKGLRNTSDQLSNSAASAERRVSENA